MPQNLTIDDFGGDVNAYIEYLNMQAEYQSQFTLATAVFSYNNLMTFLLEEVGADTLNPYNYDPIWLAALAADQTVFQNAEFKAFQAMINNGYSPGINDDEFILNLSSKLKGTQ